MSILKDVMLTVGFDADQISDQLAFKFASTDGQQPVHPTGLFEGEIYFCQGEIFHIRVIGSGRQASFTGYQIIDCCVVTRPLVLQVQPGKTPRYAPPGPFTQQIGASYPLALDFTSDAVDDKKLRLVTQNWKHTLDVGNVLGRWEMSLLLTVRIFRGIDMQDEIRVFSFDPETEVGSGRGSDEDGHP
ncbi:hypothetical protein [Duganella hordei]|uniref:hypothetical protein n=1 Tax=Duganella hordei TaxID=2865934 RepID=UPI0030E8A95C